MREGVDWALGVRGGVVIREAARTERVLMAWPGRMVGGTLTLSGNRLEWKRSRWALVAALLLLGPIVALVMNRGPGRFSLDVPKAAVAPAGRMVPWPFVLSRLIDLVGDRSAYFSTPVHADRLETPLHRRAFDRWGGNLLFRGEGRRRMVGGPRGRRRDEGRLIALAVVADCPVGGKPWRPFCHAIAMRLKE